MTARTSPLRAVPSGETPRKRAARKRTPAKPKVPTSVAQAVADFGRREQLVAMRTRIAKAIDDPNIRGADLAALSRRLLEIGKEIDALDVAAAQEELERGETPDAGFDASAV